jgi:hypothetical protein
MWLSCHEQVHGQSCFAGTYTVHEAEDRLTPPVVPITCLSYMTVLSFLSQPLGSSVVVPPPVKVMFVMNPVHELFLHLYLKLIKKSDTFHVPNSLWNGFIFLTK